MTKNNKPNKLYKYYFKVSAQTLHLKISSQHNYIVTSEYHYPIEEVKAAIQDDFNYFHPMLQIYALEQIEENDLSGNTKIIRMY